MTKKKLQLEVNKLIGQEILISDNKNFPVIGDLNCKNGLYTVKGICDSASFIFQEVVGVVGRSIIVEDIKPIAM